MAFVYCDQLNGTQVAMEDDISVVLRPLGDAWYSYDVWLREQATAYQGNISLTSNSENESPVVAGRSVRVFKHGLALYVLVTKTF